MLKLVTNSDPSPRPTKKRITIMNVMFGASAPKMVAMPNSSKLNWNALRRPSTSPTSPAISEPMNRPRKPAERKAAVCSLVANPVSTSVLFTPPARYTSIASTNTPTDVSAITFLNVAVGRVASMRRSKSWARCSSQTHPFDATGEDDMPGLLSLTWQNKNPPKGAQLARGWRAGQPMSGSRSRLQASWRYARGRFVCHQ